ncbi:hypothetical protein [Desulfosporosinus orientis]|nr:hypothetical protein [Desulfosporosinus orientis]
MINELDRANSINDGTAAMILSPHIPFAFGYPVKAIMGGSKIV